MKGPIAFVAGTFIAAVVVVVGGVYAGLTVWVRLWAYHPQAAEAISVAIAGMIFVLAVGIRYWRNRPPGGSDDGGEPRRPLGPDPQRPPGPGEPAPDWEAFEQLRSQWERVPALH